MTPFEPVRYRSFADFFDRRFEPGARVFTTDSKELATFAEARYFGWEQHDPAQAFPVKGRALRAEAILGSAERAKPFLGGPVLLARLSPMDYHRVHYPSDGRTLSHERLV
jgi:phosphatidylserine decarboxylase